MLWFGVHFPRLGLEIFERRELDRTASPAVLVEGGQVRLANVPAHRAGIVAGSTLATAHGVASGLRHFERDLSMENRQLRRLAETAYRYTSHVSVCAPDGLVLDMHGSCALFGSTQALAKGLERLFQRLRHAAHIAFAHTPAAALVLARANRQPSLAGGTKAAALDALHDVPLACAEIAAREIERLANMGIFRIGQLLALPRDELGARFGPALTDYLSRLAGDVPDPRDAVVPSETFATSVHLIEPISNKQTLLFPMRRLVAELAAWLQARQLGVLRLTWSFGPLHGAPCSVETRFARPRTDARGILEIGRLRLEKVDLPEETMSIGLAAVEVAPRPTDAGDLFEDHAVAEPGMSGAFPATGASRVRATAGKPRAPMELVDAIGARLGGGALFGLALADDHRPERAWMPRRPGDKPNTSSVAPTDPSWKEGSRPLWLFDPPRPVPVERFRLLSGPERIESGWWEDARGDTVARDYYVAVGEDGAQCWLFRSHRNAPDGTPSGSWFLHGYFA